MARRNWAVKLISFVIVTPITALVVLFCLSNQDPVTIRLWGVRESLEMDLYLVALLAFLPGFIVGATIAWAGELGHKRRAARAERKAEDLDREVALLRIREEQIRAETGGARGRPALADQRQG